MINKIQTVGLAAKGLVYTVIGVLTALAAFDMGGGGAAGKSSVIRFLQEQPFGNILLYLLSAGVLAYALWRFYTAIADPKSKGDDEIGIAQRIGYAISGLLYTFFSISIIRSAVLSGGRSGSSKQHLADQVLDTSYGPWLIGAIGIIIIGVGLYQAYKGYSGKYLEELNTGYGKAQSYIIKAGKAGFIARGVIFAIIGYFVLRAGVTNNPEFIRSTQGAFNFLQQQSYGSILMGVVAIGLAGYGIFMIYVSKDSRVHS